MAAAIATGAVPVLQPPLLPAEPLKVQLRGLPPSAGQRDVELALAAVFGAEPPRVLYLEPGKVRPDKSVLPARACLEVNVGKPLATLKQADIAAVLARCSAVTLQDRDGA